MGRRVARDIVGMKLDSVDPIQLAKTMGSTLHDRFDIISLKPRIEYNLPLK